MSERRRSLFVLLLVLGLIGGSIAVVVTQDDDARPRPPGRRPARLPGRADRAAADGHAEALQRSLDIMRERVDAFGVSEPELLLVRRQPDRGQPPGRRGRRARGRSRSARPPSCSSTTGKRTSSTRPARPTRTRTRTNAADRRSTRRSPGVQVQGRRRRQGLDPLAEDSPGSNRRRRAALLRLQQDHQEAAQPTASRSSHEEAGARGARRAGARQRRGRRGPGGHPRPARPEAPTTDGAGARPLVGHPGQPGALGHRHQEPGAELRHEPSATSRSSPSTSRTRAARRSRRSRAEIAQRGADNALGGDPPDARSTSRSCSTTSWSRRRTSTTREPGRHRRLDRRPDLRQLHDPVRAGPGEDPRDRRAADPARPSLALAGLGHARPAGARPGPDGGRRRLHHRRALPDHLLPRARRDRGARAVHLRALLLRARQADPDHADAAGHRGPDPHARRGGRREHRHLRTRQRGGARRADRRPGDHHGLQEGPDGDHRREHRHVPGRVHPVHPRDRGRPGLRAHARRRRHPLAVHGGARHPGDPVLAARHAPARARAPRSARASSKPSSRSTSWASRSGSSPCPA